MKKWVQQDRGPVLTASLASLLSVQITLTLPVPPQFSMYPCTLLVSQLSISPFLDALSGGQTWSALRTEEMVRIVKKKVTCHRSLSFPKMSS